MKRSIGSFRGGWLLTVSGISGDALPDAPVQLPVGVWNSTDGMTKVPPQSSFRV